MPPQRRPPTYRPRGLGLFFDDALVLTLDGVGEWCTTSAGVGRGNALSIERELHFPHSPRPAVTYYAGFKVNSGEYKVMGLAPNGEPRYAGTILDHIMDLRPTAASASINPTSIIARASA
jgi:predicted NodU family carbamoyl transferase